ncbi:MAG TPA: DNRLRE domain-containing protein, partial [Actinomycetota bacterium]
MALRRLLHVVFTTMLCLNLIAGLTPIAHSDGSPDEGDREELVAKRTETAKFFRQPGGTYQAEFYPSPIHFLAANGQWLDIDPTLVTAEDPAYAWRNAAGAVVFEFASSVRAGDTVRVSVSGEQLRFGPVGVISPQVGLVAGNQITYPDVFPGVDLRYTVLRSGLKEEFVLHYLPAVTSFAFEASGSLSVQATGSGAFELVDAAGEAVLRMPAPVMYESDTPEHPEPRMSSGVSLGVAATGEDQVLTFTFDPAWLADPTRRWPVFVDPTIQTLYPGSDTLVHRCYPNQNFNGSVNGNNQDLRSGTYGTCENDSGTQSLARTLMKFWPSGFPSSSDIISADLKMYNYYSSSCTARQTQVRRVTEGWGVNNATWNNQPTTTTSGMATASFAWGRSGCDSNGAWAQWNLTTMFKGWINGSLANHGISVRATDESDSLGWRRYRSTEYGSGEPRLVVTYDESPNTPTLVSPPNNTTTTANTPTFTASYSDPDGDPGYTVFEIINDVTGASVVSGHCGNVSSGSNSSWPGPSGCTHPSITLADGRYKWHASNYDGSSSSAWSGYRYYTVDTTAPDPPTVSSATHPDQGVWYSNNDPSLSWTATDVSGITGYSYALDQDADTTSEGSGTSTSYIDLFDGVHVFNVKAQNGVDMWGASAERALRIDVTPPTDPVITGSSHLPNTPSSDRTVEVSWAPSADATSGVAGYSWEFNTSHTAETDGAAEGDESTTSTTSASLSDDTWWFHVKAIDQAGNPSNDATYG